MLLMHLTVLVAKRSRRVEMPPSTKEYEDDEKPSKDFRGFLNLLFLIHEVRITIFKKLRNIKHELGSPEKWVYCLSTYKCA